MVPRDGVNPRTPAFSRLPKSVKSVISRNPPEHKGTPDNNQGPLLFLRKERRIP